jgi:hypothetical protein
MGKQRTSAEDMRTIPHADEVPHVAGVFWNKAYVKLEGIF